MEGPPQIDFEVIVFYHRWIGDRFHGASAVLGHFLNGLRSFTSIQIVAPQIPPRKVSDYGQLTAVSLVSLSWLRAATFFIKSVRRMKKNRDQIAFLAADVYIAPVVLLLARIASFPYVFFSLDFIRTQGSDLETQKYRGGSVLRLVRAPFENQLLRRSDLVIVRSRGMMREAVDSGVEASRLALYSAGPPSEEPAPSRIDAFKQQYHLHDRIVISFLGNCVYEPNQRAANFIIGDLAPKLKTLAPEVIIFLIGRGTDDLPNATDNVCALGEVADLGTVLYSSQIGIAPIDVSGGTSTKVLDYLRHGLRVLATPDAVRNMDVDQNLSVAELDAFPSRLADIVRELRSDGTESESVRVRNARLETRS